MIFTPLDQFQLISILPLTLVNFDFSLTNFLIVISIAGVGLHFAVIYSSVIPSDSKPVVFSVIPNCWQFVLETLYNVAYRLLFDNVNSEGEKYVPYVSMIFIFIILNNLIGLIPYSFTITSHIVVTFALSFSIFIGINIIGFRKHSWKMLSLIIPANSSVSLALVLVPIELISYLAKPISLGVRLFINLMAGHTLLKVIVGFSWSMLLLEDLLAFAHIIPLFLLVVLIGLELCVALIQAYVFIILTCIYLNDGVNLH